MSSRFLALKTVVPFYVPNVINGYTSGKFTVAAYWIRNCPQPGKYGAQKLVVYNKVSGNWAAVLEGEIINTTRMPINSLFNMYNNNHNLEAIGLSTVTGVGNITTVNTFVNIINTAFSGKSKLSVNDPIGVVTFEITAADQNGIKNAQSAPDFGDRTILYPEYN